MKDVISTIIRFAMEGHEKVSSALSGLGKSAGVVTHGMATLSSSLGSLGGSLGKAANQAANFLWSIQQMGAVGGIMAAAQIAVTTICNHFKEAADEMLAAVERMGEKVRSRLDKLNKARLDGVKKELDEATTKAKEAASAFDAMASSYLKVQSAQNATAKSGTSAAASALNLEKSQAMAAEKDDGKRALVGAGYDVRISKENAKAVRDEQDRSVAAAKDEASVRNHQARDAQETERKAKAALKKAKETYEEDKNTQNYRNGQLEKSAALKEAAEKAYAEAVNDRVRKEAEAQTAAERIVQAENARVAAINDARRSIIEAESAESRLIEAQRKTAEAELERLKAVKKATKVEEKKADDGNAQLLEQAKGNFASRFETAFDLWRDPEAAAQAVEADKRRGDDLKRFNREVNRYGGKGKIDEYAALMRSGDEEGMQSRLEQWRKSSRFTPQVEQMVKAEAARQNETAADRALEKIEHNTSKLAEKLDQLLSLK